MDRDELIRSWQVTRRHLDTARRQLPDELPVLEEGGSIRDYEDYLSHNELELAFDELECIGHQTRCGEPFWAALLTAAENMALAAHAERCRRQLKGLRGVSDLE
jgi:hypothetical protein